MSKELRIQKVSTASARTLPIFAEFEQLADRIRVQAYNLFAKRGAAEGHALDDWLAAEREVCWPAAELVESEQEFTLEVALAGFEPDDITVTVTPTELIVKAAHKEERKQPATKGTAKLRWTEFRSNDVYRRVELPTAVDVDKVTAKLENGLLKIVALKAEERAAAPKKVDISTSS